MLSAGTDLGSILRNSTRSIARKNRRDAGQRIREECHPRKAYSWLGRLTRCHGFLRAVALFMRRDCDRNLDNHSSQAVLLISQPDQRDQIEEQEVSPVSSTIRPIASKSGQNLYSYNSARNNQQPWSTGGLFGLTTQNRANQDPLELGRVTMVKATTC